MRSILKRFFSIFFLTAFLIPSIGETLHQLSHAHELHCNEKSTHHFHEAHHYCELCEYTFVALGNDISLPEIKIHFSKSTTIRFADVSAIHSTTYEKYFLRGPPLI